MTYGDRLLGLRIGGHPHRPPRRAMGMAYNLGRIVSAAAPYTIGKLSETHGIGSALVLMSAGFLLAAFTAWFLQGGEIRFADEPKWNSSNDVSASH